MISTNLPTKRMRRSFVATIVLSLSTAGCVPYQEIQQDTAPYQLKGSGSISGVVTIDTARGTLVAGEGTQVGLTPATRDAVARFQEYVVEKNELPENRQAQLLWFARTDAAGRFRFDGLPPGDYLLASRTSWSPSGDSSGNRSEVTYARVQLGAGEQANVTVTRRVEE
jgi:hypothetical protein